MLANLKSTFVLVIVLITLNVKVDDGILVILIIEIKCRIGSYSSCLSHVLENGNNCCLAEPT